MPKLRFEKREPTRYGCQNCREVFNNFRVLADHIHWFHLGIHTSDCRSRRHQPGENICEHLQLVDDDIRSPVGFYEAVISNATIS